MTTYQTVLAQRGYTRITIQRTRKSPGDLILNGNSVERVEVPTTVTPIGKRRVGA